MPFESDPIFSKLNDLVGDKYLGPMSFGDLTLAEQALFAVWELEQEVYNGGFSQYFQNSSGDHVPFLRDVLRAIGASNVASVIDQATALVGPGVSWGDQFKRYSAVEKLSGADKSKLDELSDELFRQSDELNTLLFRYLSKHRDQLDAPDKFWEGAATS